MKSLLLSGFVSLFVSFHLYTSAAHAGPVVLSDSNVIADVAERVAPSVVSVSATTVQNQAGNWGPFGDPFLDPFSEEGFGRPRSREGKSYGSGVVISGKGYVVTNNHVIKDARDIKVSNGEGQEWPAELVGADPRSDLAVVRLKGNLSSLRPIKIGDSSHLRLGEIVLAFGNPFNVGQTVTMGIVSAKGRGNLGIVELEDFIQTDAAINPGNSGGALVNLKGELVGINTAILSRSGGYQGIGLSIPTSMVKPISDSLIANGRIARGYLGVDPNSVDAKLAEALGLPQSVGVLLKEVGKGTPAEKAGLARNDLIVAFDGKVMKNPSQLRLAIATAGPGKVVQVEYFRGKEKRTTQVTITEPKPEALARSKSPTGNPQVIKGAFGARVEALSAATRQKYNLPEELAEGVVITAIRVDSDAEKIGLDVGDVILEINRKPMKKPSDVDAEIAKTGNKIAFLVYRDGGTAYLMMSR